MSLWSLPKVFHTCGKNCGKTARSVYLFGLEVHIPAFSGGAKLIEPDISGSFAPASA